MIRIVKRPVPTSISRPPRHVDLFVPVVPVAVHHGVDHAFPHRHADPVLFVFVETRLLGRLQNLALRQIDALQRGRVVMVEHFF